MRKALPAAAPTSREATSSSAGPCCSWRSHFTAILPDLKARAADCDAIVSILSDGEVMKLTRIGRFRMGQPPGRCPVFPQAASRGTARTRNASAGARQMKMLKRIPQMLRFIPGTAQDVRAYFLTLQYWLAGSDQNVANMIRALIDRYADGPRRSLRGALKVAAPLTYPDIGVYHPRMKGRIAATADALPIAGNKGVVGVLGLRSYMLAGNAEHYDGVISALEARGLSVVPAFASGLDSRPAIEKILLPGRPAHHRRPRLAHGLFRWSADQPTMTRGPPRRCSPAWMSPISLVIPPSFRRSNNGAPPIAGCCR